MSLREEQSQFMKHLEKLLIFIHNNGFEVTGDELFRTPEQQAIYLEGKNKRSTTLNSYHLKKLAIDLNFFKNGKLINTKRDLQEIGDYWEMLNPLNVWGGNFKTLYDPAHFERRWKG